MSISASSLHVWLTCLGSGRMVSTVAEQHIAPVVISLLFDGLVGCSWQNFFQYCIIRLITLAAEHWRGSHERGRGDRHSRFEAGDGGTVPSAGRFSALNFNNQI